jgi:hypothetical protein
MLIHPFVPSVRAKSPRDPAKRANSPFAERKQTADRKHLCRIFWRKSSPVEWDLSPNRAHKSVPLLYKFLVLTPVTRARARELNYVIMLKNDGPED